MNEQIKILHLFIIYFLSLIVGTLVFVILFFKQKLLSIRQFRNVSEYLYTLRATEDFVGNPVHPLINK